MAPVSWETVRGLAVFLVPLVLPKAISYYRSFRASHHQRVLPVQPAPRHIAVVLGLLATLCFYYIVQALPTSAQENIFIRTDSRLKIPIDVLFTRLKSLRPDGVLTDRDLALRAKLVSTDNRLLYFQYGPDVLVDCSFCTSDEPINYFYFALSAILGTHLANLAALAAATNSTLVGPPGAQWRTPATIAAVIIAVLDLWSVATYNPALNKLAPRLADLDFFFWRAHILRYLSLAILNTMLSVLIWLGATNRAFVRLPPPAERVVNATKALGGVKSKLSALAIVRNSALRDKALREKMEQYWAAEVRVMGEVMEEREVLESVNNALESRVKVDKIRADADSYAKNVLNMQDLRVVPEGT